MDLANVKPYIVIFAVLVMGVLCRELFIGGGWLWVGGRVLSLWLLPAFADCILLFADLVAVRCLEAG